MIPLTPIAIGSGYLTGEPEWWLTGIERPCPALLGRAAHRIRPVHPRRIAGRWRHVAIGELHIGGALMVAIGIGIATQSLNAADGGWRWPWLYLVVGAASWTAALGYWAQVEDDGSRCGPSSPPLVSRPAVAADLPHRRATTISLLFSRAAARLPGILGAAGRWWQKREPARSTNCRSGRSAASTRSTSGWSAMPEYRRVTDERSIDTLCKTVADLEVQLNDQTQLGAIGYIRRLAAALPTSLATPIAGLREEPQPGIHRRILAPARFTVCQGECRSQF